MNKRRAFSIAMLALGLCCVAASFFLKGEDVKAISGILIGVGGGLFGMGVSNLVMQHMERKHPELKRQNHIEQNDERNIMIRNRAKARAGDVTQWLVMGIAYLTILISAPLWLTLTVVAVYAAYHVIGIALMNKYQKEL